MINMNFDTPSDYSDYSDMLEQAHLDYLRGQLVEARQALETILAAEPANSAAADLLAKTNAKLGGASYQQSKSGFGTKSDMPSGNANYSNDLEQAHLAYLRGDLADARLELDGILAADPGNSAAADLLKKTKAEQKNNSIRPNKLGILFTWNGINKNRLDCLVVGIVALLYGVPSSVDDIKIGLAQGFGPHSVIMHYGRYSGKAYPTSLRTALLEAGIATVVGIALLLYFFWVTFLSDNEVE
jgi:hypothetical protein